MSNIINDNVSLFCALDLEKKFTPNGLDVSGKRTTTIHAIINDLGQILSLGTFAELSTDSDTTTPIILKVADDFSMAGIIGTITTGLNEQQKSTLQASFDLVNAQLGFEA